MSIEAEKAELRVRIREQRKAIPPKDLILSNQQISRQVTDFEKFREASCVFCYVGTAAEINTVPILENILQQGKSLAVPRCLEQGVMEAVIITSLCDLEKGLYGIMEPVSTCQSISPDSIDFAILPCTTCDIKGNRLGKGGGYYDRFMDGMKFYKAALCRERLLIEKVPVEYWDMPVDAVITESSYYLNLGTNL